VPSDVISAGQPAASAAPRAAVFCTALVDSDPRRYQLWIDYYTRFFAGEGVDLFLYNDGPVTTELDMKGARLITFEQTLGRQSVWIFPGWKRSFHTAVRQLGAEYEYLAHIESDLVVLEDGRADFLRHLRNPGYRTGYTRLFHMVETGLQIINSERSRRFFVQRYSDPPMLTQYERFEKVVQYALRPKPLLHGERIEGIPVDLEQHYTYLAQMPIYRFYEQFPDGEVPWIGHPLPKTSLQRLQEEARRWRWAIGYVEKRLRNRLQ
jgi:hypothetical protein